MGFLVEPEPVSGQVKGEPGQSSDFVAVPSLPPPGLASRDLRHHLHPACTATAGLEGVSSPSPPEPHAASGVCHRGRSGVLIPAGLFTGFLVRGGRCDGRYLQPARGICPPICFRSCPWQCISKYLQPARGRCTTSTRSTSPGWRSWPGPGPPCAAIPTSNFVNLGFFFLPFWDFTGMYEQAPAASQGQVHHGHPVSVPQVGGPGQHQGSLMQPHPPADFFCVDSLGGGFFICFI